MPRLCKVCTHPETGTITAALLAHQSATELARTYGFTRDNVTWHQRKHLTPAPGAPTRSRGRPSKRTPALTAMLCEALAKGNTRKAACQYVGIPYQRFADWCTRFKEFRDQIDRAEASAELRVVRTLVDAVNTGDVSAAKFWLERRRRDDWGQTQRVELTLRAEAERIAAEQGLNADELIREAERIAAGVKPS